MPRVRNTRQEAAHYSYARLGGKSGDKSPHSKRQSKVSLEIGLVVVYEVIAQGF
jgi:hypothetical protein